MRFDAGAQVGEELAIYPETAGIDISQLICVWPPSAQQLGAKSRKVIRMNAGSVDRGAVAQ
jgi:hypothetical protein